MSALAQHASQNTVDPAREGYVALKVFFNITEQWQCSPEEQRILLGGVSRATLFRYKRLPQMELSRDILDRISAVMGIYGGTQILLGSLQRAIKWIRTPSNDFNQESAMDRMLRGSLMDIVEIRRYIDGLRG
ncbi:MAG: MbcA/ParS/Xre antitoxin family protein [Pseudomonadales bacterium]|nr:MbcA/ParS/Xre antitoxin family protein [Pseudomonadales bacterium]